MARPVITLTPAQEELVLYLAGCLQTPTEISFALSHGHDLKISSRTIRRNYGHLLKAGRGVVRARVYQRINKASAEGHVAATIFMLKNLCGWADHNAIAVEGSVKLYANMPPPPDWKLARRGNLGDGETVYPAGGEPDADGGNGNGVAHRGSGGDGQKPGGP